MNILLSLSYNPLTLHAVYKDNLHYFEYTYMATYNRYIRTYNIPSHVSRYSNVGIVKSKHNILSSQFRILSIEN